MSLFDGWFIRKANPDAERNHLNKILQNIREQLLAAIAGGVNTVQAGNGIDVDATDTNNPVVSVEAAVLAGASDGATAVQPGDNVSVLVNDAGYTTNTGTVTSVAVANATGITWAGSPITTSGTLTPTLSANLQSWSGIAPASKLDASAYTAADVLAKLITVDGAGSGLDSDLLDGQSSAFYQNAGNLNAGTLLDARVAASNVTQHQSALSIDWSQLVGTIPALLVTDVYTVGSEAAQLALTAEEGDIAIRTDLNKSFAHNGGTAGTMADWSELLTPTDAVLSFNGRTGAITLTSGDVTGALGYTPLNAATYTAADVLSKLLTVDGAGSGIDADLLDGQQGSYYAAASSLSNYLPLTGGTLTGVTRITGQTLAFIRGGATDARLTFEQSDGVRRGLIAVNPTTQVGSFVVYAADGGTPLGQLGVGSGGLTYDGNAVWHAGNDGAGSGLDADLLDGLNTAADAATASTVAVRNGSGDIWARLIRSTFANQTTISGAMAFRVNNSGDEYIRFCSDTAAIRTYLGLGTAATQNTGTSGATIPLLSTANTFSQSQTVNVASSLGDWIISVAGTQAGGIFADTDTPRACFYGSAGSTLLFRPDGRGSATGQMTLDSGGNLTVAANIYSAQNFISAGGSVVLATSGAASVLLRPNGVGSGTGEATLTSAGLFTAPNVSDQYGPLRSMVRTTSALTPGHVFVTASGVTINTGAAAGSVYSVYNDSGSAITLTQGGGLTLRLSGTATTGNRTLAARGFATFWCNSTTEYIISGDVT